MKRFIGMGLIFLGTTGSLLLSHKLIASSMFPNSSGGSGTTSPLTTKGDVWGYSTTDARIPIGTNGQVLTADSAQALGLRWATPSASGITNLNTLTAATQTFATGTAGTDFAISSSSSTHTFNIPSSSASNRGLLTAADWSTFNSKASVGGSDTQVQYNSSGSLAGSANFTWTNGSSLFRINGSEILGNLTAGVVSSGDVSTAYTPNGSASYVGVENTASAFGPWFAGYKSRGTAASPTATQSGDQLLVVTGSGYGTSYAGGGSSYPGMYVLATENHSATAAGSKIQFKTVPNTTLTTTTALTIDQDQAAYLTGKLRVNNTASISGGGGLRLEVTNTGTSVDAAALYQFGATPSKLLFAQTPSTTVASPTAVTANSNIGAVAFSGYDGTQWTYNVDAAQFYARAEEAWTSSAHGTGFRWDTMPSGTTSRVNAMNLNNSGTLTLMRSGGNLLWNTDGGGTLGADSANRPDYGYFAHGVVLGAARSAGGNNSGLSVDFGGFNFIQAGTSTRVDHYAANQKAMAITVGFDGTGAAGTIIAQGGITNKNTAGTTIGDATPGSGNFFYGWGRVANGGSSLNRVVDIEASHKLRVNAGSSTQAYGGTLAVAAPASYSPHSAYTTSANAATTFTASEGGLGTSITNLWLGVGDYVKLTGLATVARVTAISTNSITVDQALGDGTSRTIEVIQPIASFRDSSNVEQVLIDKDGTTLINGGLRIKDGSNQKSGTATLVGGTVTVSNTSVTASSRIQLTCQDPNGGTPGAEYISARTPGTSFDITSTSGSDTCIVAFLIIEPN